ncbi:MAG: hemerythrin domain-containing protein [Rhizobiaceae bacterium]
MTAFTDRPISDYKLEKRSGLPHTLQVLLDEFPRDGWADHQHFHGLISFWLDRHMMFRQIMETMIEQTEQVMDNRIDPQRYSSQMARYARLFVGQLHGHHHIEDTHYFPILANRDIRLQRGFAILDADHHELDNQLHLFTDAANGVIAPAGPTLYPTGAGHYLEVLTQLNHFLERHLEDEEELVVPVILKYGIGDLT